MSNWLHINPTSGRGSTQMTISADTNQTTDIRRAKIIVTAGTLSKTIEVVQYPMAGDIMCTYNQGAGGVKLINTIGILDAVVISSEYGSVRLTGSSLNQLTANTIYTFSGQTPSQLTVNYYLNSNFNNTLTRDIFRDLNGLVSVSIVDKVNTLSESFFNNMNLERIDMYSGVTGYSMGVDYEVGGSVVYMCPKLYQFTGDSPLIYNQNMLKYQNKVIGVTLGSVSSVNIPEGVTGLTYGLCEIPSGYPNTISAVTLPSTLKTIDGHCFGNLNITGLTIPSAVTKIGLNVFSGCTQLTAITANNATCSAVTISPTTFFEIATGGILYYPEGSDYSSWLSDDEYYLGYYLWKDSRVFAIENVSTYFLQFSSGQTGSSNYQSVFVTANKPDYQINVSDDQTTTASTQTSWLTVSGTPASGYTEFKVFPTTTAITERNCYIHIVQGGQIWATITVIQLEADTSVLQVTPNSLVFSGTANDSYSAQTLTIQSTVPYTFSQGADWFTVSGTPNVGYSVLQVYPTSNNWNNTRSSYIQFYYEGGYKNVAVEQYRANKPRIYSADTYFMATKLRENGCNGHATVIIPASGGGHDYYFTTDQPWVTVAYNGGGPASAWDFSGTSSSDYAIFYNYVPEDNDTGRNRSATLSFFYDGELITAKTVYQRAFGFHTNICGEEGCEEIITVDASATSYTFTVTSTTSFYCKKFEYIYSLTATCDGYTIVANPTSSSYNPSAGTHTVTVSFPTGIDGQGRLVGSLQFAQNRGDFTGSTWNWYQVAIRQLGNLNTGKYISATTTTITASSAAQTVSVPGFACNTLWGGVYSYGTFCDASYGYDGCNIIFKENTTGQQRSYTFEINAEPVCDDGTGWLTPKTLTLTITQNA